MARTQITTIVAAVDGSKNSMAAADYAVKMAEKYGASLCVVNVQNMDQYLQCVGLYRLSYPDLVRKKVEEAKAEAQKWFSKIAKDAEERKVRIKTEVIDTPLSTVATIVGYADKQGADLIVIGTKGRSGITKLLLGSVASGVVTYAPCPVLVVK